MVGQKALIEKLDNMILRGTVPQFIVLEGAIGSGRGTIAKYLAEKLEADFIEPKDFKIASMRELIEDSRANAFRKIYFLRDAEGLPTQSANAILKLVEEPPELCTIIMSVENISSLLPTLRSRAKVFKMESYTDEELGEFTSSIALLEMCRTPGMIKSFEECDAVSTLEFAGKILSNVAKVSIMNMFTILTYINLSGREEDKYSPKLILEAIKYKTELLYKTGYDPKYLKVLYAINRARREMLNPSINKQGLFDKLLLDMREVL